MNTQIAKRMKFSSIEIFVENLSKTVPLFQKLGFDIIESNTTNCVATYSMVLGQSEFTIKLSQLISGEVIPSPFNLEFIPADMEEIEAHHELVCDLFEKGIRFTNVKDENIYQTGCLIAEVKNHDDFKIQIKNELLDNLIDSSCEEPLDNFEELFNN